MNPPALSVLIPAAGASKRLGQAKQLVKTKGISLLQNAINVAYSLKPHELIVVTGAHATAVKDSTQSQSVHWVHNPHWETGMGGSIALGARAVEPKSDGLMIVLCDQYRVDANDLHKLVNAWTSNPGRIVVAEAKDRLMPPVIFPRKCLESLQHLQGDQGAHKVLEAHRELIVPVPMVNAAFDLDTPDQLDDLL
jgi:molybdenum cofactor cytidylyltransferase